MARCRLLAALAASWLLGAGPALAAGQLMLETDPPGAEVTLDGRHLGQTPIVGASVPEGRHEVVIRRKGYQAHHLSLRVLSDLTTRRRVSLKREGAVGELVMTSEPAGAQVLLDGRPVGRTPLHLKGVRAGEHAVVLRRPGYRDGARTIRVVADLATVRHMALGPMPRRAPAPRLAVAPRRDDARPRAIPAPAAPARPRPKAAPVAPRVTAAPPVPAGLAAKRPEARLRPPAPTARPQLAERPEASVRPLAPEPSVAPAPGLPWKHMAFYGLMGMFLAGVAGLLWRRPEPRADWQADKPLARFQPLTPGRVPMAAVECCLRAIRLAQAGQGEVAAATMLAAYRQAPTVQMIYNLGLAWHLTGAAMAETAYRTALQLDPAHRDARFNLAKLLAETGRPYEAVAAYRELVAAVPGDGAAWFNLGTLEARLGMPERGVVALKRARRLLGPDPACRHNLRLARKLRPWRVWAPGGAKGLVAASR